MSSALHDPRLSLSEAATFCLQTTAFANSSRRDRERLKDDYAVLIEEVPYSSTVISKEPKSEIHKMAPHDPNNRMNISNLLSPTPTPDANTANAPEPSYSNSPPRYQRTSSTGQIYAQNYNQQYQNTPQQYQNHKKSQHNFMT